MQSAARSTDRLNGAVDAWKEENALLLELLEQARQGSSEAFETLYDRTARWLLAEVRSVVRDGQAEDVLAETYLQVWNSLNSYDGRRAPPGAWLRMIARSRALDHLRREKVHGFALGNGPAAALREAVDGADGPEQILSSAESRRLVWLSLSGLSQDEKTVIGLAYFRDHTQHEIARIIGLPVGTVKSMMLRAQDKLRTDLAPALRGGMAALRYTSAK